MLNRWIETTPGATSGASIAGRLQALEPTSPLDAACQALDGTKSTQTPAISKADAFFAFIESGGSTPLLDWFDRVTMTRLALVSRRGRALQTGVFAPRYLLIADRLDEVFQLFRPGNLAFVRDKGYEQSSLDEQTGRDPRYKIMWPAIMASPRDDRFDDTEYLMEEAHEAGLALWHKVKPVERINAMMEWQTAMTKALRDYPMHLGDEYDGFHVDERFHGHALRGGSSKSESLVLVINLAYLKCAEVSRRCETCERGICSDIFLKGWHKTDFFSSSRRDLPWSLITDDTAWLLESGVQRFDPFREEARKMVVTEERIRHLCAPDVDVLALAPLLGAEATRGIMVCQGLEEDWSMRTVFRRNGFVDFLLKRS